MSAFDELQTYYDPVGGRWASRAFESDNQVFTALWKPAGGFPGSAPPGSYSPRSRAEAAWLLPATQHAVQFALIIVPLLGQVEGEWTAFARPTRTSRYYPGHGPTWEDALCAAILAEEKA